MSNVTVADAARQVAKSLLGTCDATLETTLEKLGLPPELESNSAFLYGVDELVFECTCCGWWCSQDECNEDANNQWICDDCASEI